ncbi:MAG: hypothetical protein NC078_01975 [Ruminococcus sp.]|nr:hypothetical protein [Ruminococcus sp.]
MKWRDWAMTQDSSIKKEKFFSPAMLHNGVMGFKHNFKLAVVLFVLHMAALPLTLSMLIYSIFSEGRAEADGYMIIAVLTTGAAAAAGILCALSSMPYLYKKSVVDMRLSLPMTTLQRFVSDFISGLCVYVIPFIVSSVISLLITLAGHLTCDGVTFYRSYDYEKKDGWECHLFEEAAPVLIRGIIGAVFIMVMFYTLTLLVSCCCGSVFECVCYTLLANGLIPGTAAVAIMALLDDIYGLVPESYAAMVIPYTSPIGGCIGLMFALSGHIEGVANTVPSSVTYGKWLLIFGLFTLLYIFCTYLIYRKRKAEDTGNPIVYSAMFHIVMTLGTACIVFTFLYDSGLSEIFPMVIVTGIVYFVFSVIRRRGFKKFWRSAVSYVCTMIACIGCFALVTATEGFGAKNYVPNANAVAEVYLDYSGAYENPLDVDFSGFDISYNEIPLKITDRDALEIVTDVHSLAVNHSANDSTSRSFGMTYRLKSGRLVIRKYSLTDDAIRRLADMDMLRETKEFRAQRARQAAFDLYTYSLNSSSSFGYDYDYYSGSSPSLTLTPQWRLYNDDSSSIHPRSIVSIKNLPDDFKTELGECLYNDIAEETEEEYFSDPHGIFQLFSGTDSDYYYRSNVITIRGYYRRTLDYLKRCGFDTELELPKSIGINAVDRTTVAIVSGKLMEDFTGRDIPAFTACASAKGVIANISFFDYSHVRDYHGLTEDLYTVMANSYKQYKTDESCYTIIVNGNAAVIDPRCNAAAERLFINAVLQDFVYYMSDTESWVTLSGSSRAAEYKAFLGSFLDCYGRDKIDSFAASGMSFYDGISDYINGVVRSGRYHANESTFAEKYRGYSSDADYYRDYGFIYNDDYAYPSTESY